MPRFFKYKMHLIRDKKQIGIRNIKNFRDLGGLPTKDGKFVKHGLFMRSGHLAGISLEDINYLVDKHLGSIIDLRTPEETEDHPDQQIQGVQYRSIPIFKESILGITHELKGKSMPEIARAFSAERIRSLIPDMPKLYQSMITNVHALRQIAEVMHQIIHTTCEEKSTLFHCTVGKDRTGVISALLLSTLGVDEEVIVEDYMRSNAAIRWRAAMIFGAVALFKLNRHIARDIRDAYLVNMANIRAVFDVIREEFGTTDNFIRTGLMISDRERELFLQSGLTR